MEKETIETFLAELGLKHHVDKFHEQEVDLELLKKLTENEIKEILQEIKLPAGGRMKILKTILEKQLEPLNEGKNAGDISVKRDSGMIEKEESTELYNREEKSDSVEERNTGLEGVKTLIGSFEKWAKKLTNKPCSPHSRLDTDKTGSSVHEEGMTQASTVETEEKDRRVYVEEMSQISNSGVKRKVQSQSFETHNKRNEVRLVLLGKTGSGKSATGNTILGEEEKKWFHSVFSFKSVTRKCSQNFVERFGHKILVVDTPGIFDTEESNDTIQEEIYKCIGITSPGPHAFILVLNITSRFTQEEEQSVQHFVHYFGEKAYKYFIVLFTRMDELGSSNKAVENHVKDAPKNLKQFIEKCGGRIIGFNNKLKGKQQDNQVKELLRVVMENVKANGGEYYTNEMYLKAEKELKNYEKEELRKQREQLKKIADEHFQKGKLEEVKVNELRKEIEELKAKQLEESNKDYSKILSDKEEAEKRIEKIMKENEKETRRLQEEIEEKVEARAQTIRDETREAIEKNSSWCSIS